MPQKRRYEVFVSMILFVALNLHTCCGLNDCYRMSSGKDICFTFDETKQTFEESKQLCKTNGGFLLEIHNKETQTFVEAFVKSKATYLDVAWLNLVRTNSVWVWGGEVSGHYLTYSNWDEGNPLQNGINKASMIITCKWVNRNQNQASTICFKENPSTYSPEPSTTTTTRATTRTTTTTTSSLSPSTSTIPYTQPTESIELPSTSNSVSSPVAIGIGVGVGLGGLVLIIVSSLLVAKFVFHKEIPLPFKSSSCIKSSPYETGSDVTNGDYEYIDEKKLADRSPYAELILPDLRNIVILHKNQPSSTLDSNT